jgi:SAM-dependent methyltransferase
MPPPFYSLALAAIHQEHFEPHSVARGRSLLALLRRSGIRRGLVVDLACGPGAWALELTKQGYDVLGVDLSPAMIRLARKRAPRARFLCASITQVRLPKCDAITGLGEPFNYLRASEVRRVLRNAYRALRPGGVLAFDTVEPPRGKQTIMRERSAQLGVRRMVARIVEDPRRRLIVRRITVFHPTGRAVREIHRQRMYAGRDLAAWLRRIGFRARVVRDARLVLSPRHALLVARKT